MSIYYKYAPDGTIFFVLSYVDDCVYWYTNDDLGKWFVDTSTKRLVSMGFSHEHNRTDSTVTLIDLPRFHQNVPQYCRAFVYPSGSICRN